MNLEEWCSKLELAINNLSQETQKHIPYVVKDQLQECLATAQNKPNCNAKIKIALSVLNI